MSSLLNAEVIIIEGNSGWSSGGSQTNLKNEHMIYWLTSLIEIDGNQYVMWALFVFLPFEFLQQTE